MFPSISVESIQRLLENRLYESAEYWMSIWICEKNLPPSELGKRYCLYGDCLYASRKYSQAFYYYQLSHQLIPEAENQDHILYRMYECKYECAEDKEDRNMLRDCIYILEEIPEESRSVIVLSALARLYWSVNNYAMAKDYALREPLDLVCYGCRIEPLAMEAVSILSRLHDFKGTKHIEVTLPTLSSDPIESALVHAEFQLFHNPAQSLQAWREVRCQCAPCPLLYQRIGLCYTCLNQPHEAIRWYERMQSLDETHLFESTTAMAALLARIHSIPLSSSSLSSLPLVKAVTDYTINTAQSEQVIHAYIQRNPLQYALFAIRCYRPLHDDLGSMEQMYWDMINYYPSYSSYMALIMFYLEQFLTKKAIVLARQIQATNAENLYANLILAKTLIQAKEDLLTAEILLQRCVKNDPHHMESHYLLARLLHDRGEYDKALEVLNDVLQDEISPEMKELLCECYLQKGLVIPYFRMQHSLSL